MNQKLSILIATGIYPPDIGGPATYVAGLVPRLQQVGYVVRVITYADSVLGLDSSGVVSVSRRWPKFIRHIIYFLNVCWFGISADIIYLQDVVSAGVPTVCANFFLRRKLILKIVGDYAWERLQHQQIANRKSQIVEITLEKFQAARYGLWIELLRWLEHIVARRADQIIVPSQYLARIVAQWGITPRFITVIYNAVTLSTSDVERVEHDLRDRKAFLAIGRLVQWKGFRYLIKLMRQLPERELYIVGDGPERDALNALSHELHVEDRVHIVGMVPHDQLIDYFQHARIFLLNSRYEGLSHVLIESLQYGVPAIATNIGGNPEVIRDGENGFLVPYDSPLMFGRIKQLYDDDVLWEKMSHAARVSARQFSWETHMDQLRVILQYSEVRLPENL